MTADKKYIEELLAERNKLRSEKKFIEADFIREKISGLGYDIKDGPDQTTFKSKQPVKKESGKNKTGGFLVLFGSGEISNVGQKAGEYVFGKIGKRPVNVAIISTPAGFQPNVKAVHEEIADFFTGRLKNYHPSVSVIYANNSDKANDESITKDVENADFIFMGPGSPTYARKNLENTLLLNIIQNAVKNGKSLCLSSAAVAAFSRFTLPVYEIYKAGSELYWERGLDFFGKYLGATTVIPHKNNSEGGTKLDTSYCYMGKERFMRLRKLLPRNEKMIGIDEHTALICDLKNNSRITIGKGSISDL